MNRDMFKTKYNQLYKTIIPFDDRYYEKCFYCGEAQDVYDHYPALATMDKIHGIYRGDCLLIPSCRSCNAFLSDSFDDSIDGRIKRVKKLIYVKNNKSIVTGFKWLPEEIKSLSKGNLLDMVLTMKYKSIVMIDRLNFKPYDFYIMIDGEKKKYHIPVDIVERYSYLLESLDEQSEDLEKLFRKYLYTKV